MAVIQMPSIASVVEDKSPSLGGDLNAGLFSTYWYNVDDGAGNYERLEVKWDTNEAKIESASAGTGTLRNLQVGLVNDYMLADANGVKLFAGGTERFDVRDGYVAVGPVSVFRPASDNSTINGAETRRWANTYSVDGSFSGNLVSEVGGSYKLYSLGAEGDANTQHFEITYGSNDVKLSTESSGTGIGGKILFVNNGSAALNLTLSTAYIYRNFFPSSSSLLLGNSGLRWGDVYSVDGSFSGDLVVEDGGNQYFYNTYTDANNYERLEVKWDSNVAKISTSAAGTGADRDLEIWEGGVRMWAYSNASNIAYRPIRPNQDSIRGLGTTSSRWAHTYTDVLTVGDGVDTVVANSSGITIDGQVPSTTPLLVKGAVSQSANLQEWQTGAGAVLASVAADGSMVSSGDISTSGTLTANTIDTTWVYAGGDLKLLMNANGFVYYDKLRPQADGKQSVGLSTQRFGNFYGVDGSFEGDLVVEDGGNQYFYNTYTDASNYERLEVKWDSDYAVIATTADGTGSNRTIQTSNLEIRGRTSTTETYLSLKRDNDTSVITVQSNGTGATRIQGDHTFDVTTDTTTGTLSLGNYNGRHGVQITNEGYNVGIGRVAPAVDGVTIGRSEYPVMLNGSGTFIYNNNNVDEVDYERLEIKWDANVAYISTTSAGTGSARALYLDGESQIRLTVNSGLEWIIDGTRSIVYSSELRPGNASQTNLGINTSRWKTLYTDGVATDVETFTAASDTLDANNNVALCDCTSNAITINLPAASTASGLQYHVKKTDSSSNMVTIVPDGSETIDGQSSAVLNNQYESRTLVSDGSNWFII